MEQEFDKEIDALLRKWRPADTASVAHSASVHLEPDDVVAFAENALPASAKQVMTLHLADCERCRKILSGTIRLTSDVTPRSEAAVAAPTIAATQDAVPWYRRLLLFPNLAYVMGALVLIFSGFLGYIALRENGVGETTISQVVDNEGPAASGPNAGSVEYGPSSGLSANTAANTSLSATNSTSAPSNRLGSNSPSDSLAESYADAKREDSAGAAVPPVAGVLDGASVGQPPAPPATTMAAPRDERVKAAAELSKEKDDAADMAKSDAPKIAQEREEAKLRSVAGAAAKKSVPAGPNRDMQSQFPNRVQNYAIPTKNAGGKTFELRDGVWYDTAYRGQATINVSRGTEAFLRLEGKLRSIAETVGGTSIIVWSGKAYRIQ